jgi:hypothetical protein
MSDPSVEDAVKQLVLANADGEIKSLVFVMLNKDGEPELQIAMAPGTAYAIISSLEILKLHIINRLTKDGAIEPKDRE